MCMRPWSNDNRIKKKKKSLFLFAQMILNNAKWKKKSHKSVMRSGWTWDMCIYLHISFSSYHLIDSENKKLLTTMLQ